MLRIVKMLTSFQPRFKIQDTAWESFKTYVNETYPRSSFTHEQKEFVNKFLKQDNGECSDLNKLWINYVADQLVEFADNWPASHEAISDQIERLQAITGKAILGFFNVQHMIRNLVPVEKRSAEQNRLLEVHPHILNYPVELTVDIGRILRLPHMHTTDHLDPEEKAVNQHLFHELHNFITQGTTSGEGSETQSRAGDDAVTGEWDPHSSEDTYLRLCTYKVWCEKYEEENDWSPAKMVGPWLREAINLYNKISYHWPHCRIKRFTDDQFSNIRMTARNSWLAGISHRTKFIGKAKKPTSNWVTDWCTYPVTERRHEWESYFCSVVMHAKNLAKLLHKNEHVHDVEEEGTDEPPVKRTRMEENDEADENSLEVKISRIIAHEMQEVRRMLVQVDRNSTFRHQEALREMLGHFNPLRNQLHHLSVGQHHITRALDKAVSSSST